MTDQRNIGKAQRHVLFAMCFIALFALLSVTVTVLLLLPYKPMQIYSYTPDRSEVCPGGVVEVYIEYELTGALQVNRIEADSSWTAIDVPQVETEQQVGGLEGTLPVVPPNETITGILPRIAPPSPGEWLLGSEITVRGSVYGLPHVQSLETQAQDTITVLSPEDSRCGRGS